MRGLRPCPRALAASAALVALLARGAAAAPWQAHYERGVRLLKDGEAAKAEPELRAALEGRAHAGCRVRIYGVKYRDYIPHYELGMALLEQGRESEAAVEFSLEMGDGVIDTCLGTREQALSLRENVARLALAESPAAAGQVAPTAPPEPPTPTLPEPAPAAATAAAPAPEPAHHEEVLGQPAPRPKPASAATAPAVHAAIVDPRSLLQLTWSASMHGPPAILHVTRP
jgi:hypothetical protein